MASKWIRLSQQILIILLGWSLVHCASQILQYDKADQLLKNEDYDQQITVKEIPITTPPPGAPTLKSSEETQEKKKKQTTQEKSSPTTKSKKKVSRQTPKTSAKGKKMVPEKHEPQIEDSEGFVGRRPQVDPFVVGEKITLSLSYFNVVAGYLDLEVLPFVEVNGVKSYKFQISAKSNALFSHFYSVQDQAVTFMDFENMVPLSFTMTVKESKQLADIRTIFDWKNLKGNYWEKRVRKDKPEENRRISWNIKSFSQNVVSAIFYLRTFKLTPGKKLSFYVADDGKNILFEGDVLRREKLTTEIGELNTVVIQPRFQVDGVFKPVGEILIWLTDDDRKFVVRIESKIKIGTVVGKVKSITQGFNN